jgi:hypothetical protein
MRPGHRRREQLFAVDRHPQNGPALAVRPGRDDEVVVRWFAAVDQAQRWAADDEHALVFGLLSERTREAAEQSFAPGTRDGLEDAVGRLARAFRHSDSVVGVAFDSYEGLAGLRSCPASGRATTTCP